MSRDFNGSSDRARYAGIAQTSFPFTIMGWVNLDSNTTEQYLGGLYDSGADDAYVALWVNTDGTVRATTRNAGGQPADWNASPTLSTGTWTFVAAMFGGSGTTCTSRKAVIGTTVSAGETTSATYDLSTYERTSLGARDRATVGAWANGKLAYFAIVDKILTTQEISDLQTNAPHVVFSANKVHYWRLDQNDSPVNDEWGSADLTLTGTTHSTDNPSLTLTDTVTKLKLLAHSSAASAAGVAGVVFAAPAGGAITGAEIGEFTGAAFEATLESGKAVLKVACSDFGGTSLTTSDTPVALVRNSSNTTGIVSCTVIEE